MKVYRAHILTLGLYTLLTLLLTWPWAANFRRAFPGTASWAFDESTFIWNIWRFKHNVLDLQISPLHTDEIFFPLGIDLVLYTYNFANALFGLPLLLATGLPLAANLTLLFAYVSSGYGTYLLLRYLFTYDGIKLSPRVAHLAAFAGGAVYAFAASRAIFAALGHYDIVSTNFIPFYALFFLKSLREPGLKNVWLTAIFATLCLLAEMIFGVFLLFLGLIMLYFHRKPDKRRKPGSFVADDFLSILERTSPTLLQAVKLLPKMILLAVAVAVLWSPVMVPIVRAFTDSDYALQGWGESLKLSADLVGWFTPTDLHPLFGSDWVPRLREVQAGTAPFSDVNTVFLGYGTLIFSLLAAAIYWRQLKLWLTTAIVFAVFTLGPVLQIHGQFLFPMDNLFREQGIAQDVTFPLPFMALHYLPFVGANRAPARFSVVLALALAVLAAYGVAWLLQKLAAHRPAAWQFGLTTLFTGLLLFDQLALPLPLTSAEVPGVYTEIAAEEEDFTLLQLPLGWRNSFGVFGAERTQLQYYQHVHGKPMLGGNISRSPAFKFDYYRGIPLFQAFAQTQLPQQDPPVDDQTLEQARQQAGELMTLYNVGYVLVHTPIESRKPYEDTWQQARALAFDLLPLETEATYRSPEVEAYRVIQPPIPDVLRLDFGDWPSFPYRGEGWGGNEFVDGASANWVVEPRAQIFFPYRGDGDRQLAMHLTRFNYPGAPQQTLTLVLNDEELETRPLAESWQVLETTLPAASLQPGLNRLELHFSQQAVPRAVLPANTAIGQTGRNVPVDIEINSHPDFAFITVGFGENSIDASSHRRGFNIAVLDAENGAVLDQRGFDTAANGFEAEALRDYLAAIPDGRLVLVSSQGADAAAFLPGVLDEGFAGLGGSPAIPPIPYSLVGIKGAAPGSAVERSGPDAYLRLGAVPDDRPLSAAVDWVEIRR